VKNWRCSDGATPCPAKVWQRPSDRRKIPSETLTAVRIFSVGYLHPRALENPEGLLAVATSLPAI
jgi:hypothetical protein